MVRAYIIAFLCLLTACQSPLSSSLSSSLSMSESQTQQVQQNQDSSIQLELQGQTIPEAGLQDFLIQRLKQAAQAQNRQRQMPKAQSRKPQALGPKTWYQAPRHGDWLRSPELLIEEVLLTESDASIYGAEAPAAIAPDFAGKEIQITLKGTFKNYWRALPERSFRFTLDPELLVQSFVGLQPQARVLMDHSLLLEVDSVSEDEIVAHFNSERIPDFYLKGLHRISVEYGRYYTDGLIQVGEPEPVEDLQPRIDAVEVLRDRRGKPLHLRLSGDNFMLFPKFSYALIDGEFGFGYQTEVLRDGGMETVVHVPDPETFDDVDEHLVIYATPFGVAFGEFE